jgi:hypothetical protein
MMGDDGQLQPRKAAQMMRDPSKLAGMLNDRQVPGAECTTAEIMADIINGHRADTKALADAVGAQMDVSLMTPDRAAELIAGVTDGSVEIVEVFNELAEDRDRVLQALLDREEYEGFMDAKLSQMHTPDPTGWEYGRYEHVDDGSE